MVLAYLYNHHVLSLIIWEWFHITCLTQFNLKSSGWLINQPCDEHIPLSLTDYLYRRHETISNIDNKKARFSSHSESVTECEQELISASSAYIMCNDQDCSPILNLHPYPPSFKSVFTFFTCCYLMRNEFA